MKLDPQSDRRQFNFNLSPLRRRLEYFLGKDYPFFIAEPTKEQILEGYKLVKESVGTSDWKFALDTMDELRHRSSPVTVVNELGQILDVVLD